MFTPGPIQMLIVLAVILLLFGGTRLPKLMRSLGQSVVEFKKGVKDIKDIEEDAEKNEEASVEHKA